LPPRALCEPNGHVGGAQRAAALWLASADLFGQGDDDARGAAEVAEREDALVLCHLAEESAPWARRRRDGIMDVVDSKHDPMQAQRVGRRVLRLGTDRRGGGPCSRRHR
jgi:hypothetical protein